MKKLVLLAVVTVGSLVGCSTTRPAKTTEGPPPTQFTKHIKPIFERRCVACHNPYQRPAGLDLTSSAGALTGKRVGTGQPFIVTGEPERSLIYLAIMQPANHPRMMPGDGWGLSSDQENHVYQWIKNGAEWPTGFRGKLREKELRVEFDGDL